ncbi:MAG TPA: polysaccharide deacetylase family protein [Mobilitalea sp.]|nr:polysaccharide deacetylase family protein [Mobilitalea sp.]
MNKLMNKKVVLIICIALIYMLGMRKLQGGIAIDEAAPAFSELHSIELMAVMENRMAREYDPESSQTATEETPDYTRLYPDLYTVYNLPENTEDERKIAYLTFDDGPSGNTFEILDILEEADVRATFFIVGSTITDEGESCLKRMKNEGHTIGIHTYSHLCNEIYCSVERFLNDFNTVYQQIYDITGERVNIYRFPWGSNNGYSKGIKDSLMEEMERRGFNCYDWNVDANDSIGRPTAYSIRHNIEKDMKNQDHPIILMHDSVINDLTAQALPDVIRMIKDKGYEFDTLDNREPYQFNW